MTHPPPLFQPFMLSQETLGVLPVVAWVMNERGHVVFVNEAFERTCGVTMERLPSDFAELCDEHDRAFVRSAWREAHEAHATLNFEARVLTAEGYRWWHIQGMAQDAAPRAWLCLATDVHERHAALERSVAEADERARLTEALQQTLARLEMTLSAGQLGLWEADLASGKTAWEGEMDRLYGLQRGEFDGTDDHFRRLVHLDDHSRMQAAYEQALRTGVYSASFRAVHPDGSTRWLQSVARVVRDHEGRPVKLIGVNYDITERIEAAEALSASEQRFRLLAEHASDLVCLMSPEGVYLYASPSHRRILGFEPDELIGRNVYELFPPHDLSEIERSHEAVLAGRPFTVTYRGQRKDGTPLWLESTSLPILSDDGQVSQLQVTTRDVTERVEAREALERLNANLETLVRERTETLQAVIRGAPIILYSVSPDGTFVLSEGQGLGKLGLSGGEIVGQNIFELYASSPETLEFVRRALSGELATGVVKVLDLVWEMWVAPRFDEAGRVCGMIGVSTEVTERVKAEEELRRANASLRRSNEELERFAYVASHDLQQPLRAVTSFTGLLERRLEPMLDDKTRQYMTYVKDGAKRMKTLVDDLLAFARLDSAPPRFDSVNVADIARTVLQDLQAELDESGAVVTSDDLPLVRGDSSQLTQLLQNLLSNALKFRRDAPSRVHVGVTRSGMMWHFTVSDNGIGIRPEHFDRIFEMFERLHTREQYEGNGVGLAICRKIVEGHGGRLWLESTPEIGTTFHFILPGVTKGRT
ncbi:PAS domain-containing sensor histidine kinase [Deinococcus yavapaiensis]|uniref:histidine kinase n=1 Tax=Deinococcus yavapaiensis KR-236 TaxID=694435 RepID=A0A318S5T5_9DEIO|nr:PAS domain S-box protein [Deinococcus yavapaiensis]PYE52965.1 PAS domain S-box-containing protein [Deinococcus yavapaiensis KR-236]